MAKKKDKTVWWILALGGIGAAWYLMKNKAAGTPPAALLPAATTPDPNHIIPGQLTAPGGITPIIPSNTSQSLISPQGQFNPPAIAPPSTPAITITTPSPIPVAATGPTVDQMNTLQSWAQSALNPCDLGRWNQYKSSFTPDEWASMIDIYFNDWVGGEGNTPERVKEWDDFREKYQILTNTPC